MKVCGYLGHGCGYLRHGCGYLRHGCGYLGHGCGYLGHGCGYLGHGCGYLRHGCGYLGHGCGYLRHGCGYLGHGCGYLRHGCGRLVMVVNLDGRHKVYLTSGGPVLSANREHPTVSTGAVFEALILLMLFSCSIHRTGFHDERGSEILTSVDAFASSYSTLIGAFRACGAASFANEGFSSGVQDPPLEVPHTDVATLSDFNLFGVRMYLDVMVFIFLLEGTSSCECFKESP